MASVQSLVRSGVTSCVPSSGIAGVPCQLARKARGGRRNAQGGGGPLLRIRAQGPAEDGGGSEGKEGGGGEGDDDFEARLARIQRKSASGTGKKAEIRKARKQGGDASADSPASRPDGVFIEPVPLKEAVSGGVNVQLGLTPYTERLHGRLAALGVAAVLLVELATGDSLIKFHDSGTISVQVYAVFAAAALFVKYEKERMSVWPKS